MSRKVLKYFLTFAIIVTSSNLMAIEYLASMRSILAKNNESSKTKHSVKSPDNSFFHIGSNKLKKPFLQIEHFAAGKPLYKSQNTPTLVRINSDTHFAETSLEYLSVSLNARNSFCVRYNCYNYNALKKKSVEYFLIMAPKFQFLLKLNLRHSIDHAQIKIGTKWSRGDLYTFYQKNNILFYFSQSIVIREYVKVKNGMILDKITSGLSTVIVVYSRTLSMLFNNSNLVANNICIHSVAFGYGTDSSAIFV